MKSTSPISGHGCFVCMISGCAERICARSRRVNQWLDRHLKDLLPIFMRLLLAYEFGEAGLEKLHGDNWFAGLSFPFPFNLLSADVNWTMATVLEIIAPIALILGFMTRFFSAALMLLTLIAIAAVHWPADWHSLAELWQGYAITDKGHGNYKLPLMYLLMLAALSFSGAGHVSLDVRLRGH
ncbi:MAG: HvfX family Cu-binding RiPP maturation protein [Gammaproteobacteria bacterium]